MCVSKILFGGPHFWVPRFQNDKVLETCLKCSYMVVFAFLFSIFVAFVSLLCFGLVFFTGPGGVLEVQLRSRRAAAS